MCLIPFSSEVMLLACQSQLLLGGVDLVLGDGDGVRNGNRASSVEELVVEAGHGQVKPGHGLNDASVCTFSHVQIQAVRIIAEMCDAMLFVGGSHKAHVATAASTPNWFLSNFISMPVLGFGLYARVPIFDCQSDLVWRSISWRLDTSAPILETVWAVRSLYRAFEVVGIIVI